ncbi:tol-pal system-associated acyl-CoA thioesterase [Rhodoferax sp. 4810]|uniref:Tol-pal system-associated acyl-CoA thioesterase n=2 Tax=Thiospirillum jenense TaxID=1653858 RepID=A0A839HC87_9GAMM|nr:tol-pal system-associated acyl-CoA thioesterase [Rhodoferax jenense]MBB1126281.1 tol-pal system-associated acyl-CoA thioesterase [Thiospirillum jenense]
MTLTQSQPLLRWPVRIYYEDTDAGGVVYHASYLRFMERARTEWLRGLGFEHNQLRTDYQTVFALRQVQVQFVSPALLNDELVVNTQIVAYRHASIDFHHELIRLNDGRCCCRADANIVSVNAENWRPARLPAALLELIINGQ